MAKIYNRTSLTVGSKVKITKIRSGVDNKNLPYWKFYVPFTTLINGNPVLYKHLWCRVAGTPKANEGDWVEIKQIFGLYSNCRHDQSGGMAIFEDLSVEVEKLEKENN